MKMIKGRKYLILNGHYAGTTVIYLKNFKPEERDGPTWVSLNFHKFRYEGLFLNGVGHPHEPYTEFLFGAKEDFPIIESPQQLIEDFIS